MGNIVAIVGRPNVGKSTLYNRLVGQRDAITDDFSGVTRDRKYGFSEWNGKRFTVVDTGGFVHGSDDVFESAIRNQVGIAIEEAAVILFMVDAQTGITDLDEDIAKRLRRTTKPVFVVVNKVDNHHNLLDANEFWSLGFEQVFFVASISGSGTGDLLDAVVEHIDNEPELETELPKFAIVGRPNVGKSTLINTLLGEERVIAFDQPGTTRDSIYIDFTHKDKQYTLIDTAGLRRRGQVHETVEKFSVIKTLQTIEDANVVVLVLDARNEISDQDAHIAGFILETGRALVIVVNKWDGLDDYQRDSIKRELNRKLAFLSFAQLHYISALHGTGMKNLLPSIDAAYAAAMAHLPTPKLTRALIAAVAKHPPPRGGMSRPKMRYAHQGGSNPPLIIVHGSMLEHVPDSYRRYLENTFRETFKLSGTPLRVDFKVGHNPYADKKPTPPTEDELRRAHNRRRRNRKKYG